MANSTFKFLRDIYFNRHIYRRGSSHTFAKFAITNAQATALLKLKLINQTRG